MDVVGLRLAADFLPIWGEFDYVAPEDVWEVVGIGEIDLEGLLCAVGAFAPAGEEGGEKFLRLIGVGNDCEGPSDI